MQKDRTLGLYQKYHVERTDGAAHSKGDKFFVLNYGNCLHAQKALETFADSIRETHPLLARDLYREIFGDPNGATQMELPLPTGSMREAVGALNT